MRQISANICDNPKSIHIHTVGNCLWVCHMASVCAYMCVCEVGALGWRDGHWIKSVVSYTVALSHSSTTLRILVPVEIPEPELLWNLSLILCIGQERWWSFCCKLQKMDTKTCVPPNVTFTLKLILPSIKTGTALCPMSKHQLFMSYSHWSFEIPYMVFKTPFRVADVQRSITALPVAFLFYPHLLWHGIPKVLVFIRAAVNHLHTVPPIVKLTLFVMSNRF